MFYIEKYEETQYSLLIDFLEECLPESGRKLELEGRHKIYKDINGVFEAFWCSYSDGKIVGTVALKELDKKKCELKSLYLLEKYHGRGLGHKLLMYAINYAKENGYKEMYLDTISTSQKAIHLYKQKGFVVTEKYNQNDCADVFMVLEL